MNINWAAVDNAARYYRTLQQDDYTAWILEEGGIDHGVDYIRIVDEERYMLFKLRWT